MTQHGWGFVRFDFSGIGESGGEFIDTCFATDVADIHAVIHAMRESGRPPQLLIGHSLGGAASIQAAAEDNAIRAVATIAAPFHRGDVVHRFLHLQQQVEAEGSAEIDIGGQRFRIGRKFMDDARLSDLSDALRQLAAAILIMHAPDDETVSIDNASKLFMAAHHPKSYVSLAGADHLLSNREDADYAGHMIHAWSSRYLD